jgi:hypothetical protein
MEDVLYDVDDYDTDEADTEESSIEDVARSIAEWAGAYIYVYEPLDGCWGVSNTSGSEYGLVTQEVISELYQNPDVYGVTIYNGSWPYTEE